MRADSGKNQSKHTIIPIRAPACSKMRNPVSPGRNSSFSPAKQVRLAIDLDHAGRTDRRRRVVQPFRGLLGESSHDDAARPARQPSQRRQKRPGAVARLAEGTQRLRRRVQIAGIRQLGQHQQIGFHAVQQAFDRGHVRRHVVSEPVRIGRYRE